MVAFWNTISRWGLKPDMSGQQGRAVLLTNRLTVILLVLNTVTAFARMVVYGWDPIIELMLLNDVFYVAVLLLNHRGNVNSSRLLLSVFLPVNTLLLTIINKMYRPDVDEVSFYSSRIVLLFASVLPPFLFQLREKFYLLIGLGVCAICLIFFDLIHNLAGVGYYQLGFDAVGYPFFNLVTLILYALLISSFWYYKTMLEKTESDLWTSNQQLLQFYNELGHQHEEIQAQTEKLTESQQQLQEANQLIEQQKSLLEAENIELQQHLLEKNKILEASNQELHSRLEEMKHFSYTISHF